VQALLDGTILLTGSVNLGYPSYTGSLAMARLTASGSLDTRFGEGPKGPQAANVRPVA
jgi:hypothetical protein